MARPHRLDKPEPRVAVAPAKDPARQAFRILQVAFVLAPIVAGLDKFFGLLVNWDQYLAPSIAGMLPVAPHTFMMAVGVIEIIAGLVVAFRPYYGGYLVTLWLYGIIVNLLLARSYYDVALRDFGLSLGASALARLSRRYGPLAVD
ncbi:MAG TPA: hypothetical protein VFL90_01000 [Methylomirabilota bacterium]|nr:hypothetical protein [Methylomirabilota bacterium]